MRANLRPMNLGEILDRTFQIYRAKFLTFVAIAALPATVIIALEAANRLWWGLTPEPFRGDIPLALLQGSIYSVAIYQIALPLHLLVWPAYAYLSSKLIFEEGSRLTVAAFRGNAGWRTWLWMAVSIWGIVLILPELIMTGLFIAFYFFESEVMKVSSTVEDWFMPTLLCILFAIGGIVFFWLSSAFFFVIQVKSMEGMTVGKALRRSWTLSKGCRIKTIFVRCSLFVIGWSLNVMLLTLFAIILWTIVRFFGVWLPHYRNLNTAIGFFTAFTISVLFGPIFPIGLTLIYYDQRIRHEGYDIERMMDAAGLNAPATSTSEGAPAAPAEATEGQI